MTTGRHFLGGGNAGRVVLRFSNPLPARAVPSLSAFALLEALELSLQALGEAGIEPPERLHILV